VIHSIASSTNCGLNDFCQSFQISFQISFIHHLSITDAGINIDNASIKVSISSSCLALLAGDNPASSFAVGYCALTWSLIISLVTFF